jgi:hypothetical protein
MTGRKTLVEIRTELETVMDRIPSDAGSVTKALLEFLSSQPVGPTPSVHAAVPSKTSNTPAITSTSVGNVQGNG